VSRPVAPRPDAPPGLRRPAPEEEYYFAEGCHIIETWNTAADPALSVARARVAPGVTTRWHRLDGICERYLIVSGEGVAELQGQAPMAVVAGDLVHIPAGLGQRITNTGSADLVFYALCTPRFVVSAYHDLDGG
jgi:mannose-6-phosphate isomerase-like protein (cupin superfamily)